MSGVAMNYVSVDVLRAKFGVSRFNHSRDTRDARLMIDSGKTVGK